MQRLGRLSDEKVGARAASLLTDLGLKEQQHKLLHQFISSSYALEDSVTFHDESRAVDRFSSLGCPSLGVSNKKAANLIRLFVALTVIACRNQMESNRSSVITFVHAPTKSRTNFSCPSLDA